LDLRNLARIEGPIFAIAAALMVERIYYVIARLAVNTQLDLWSAHPAPEALSFALAAAIFALAVAIRRMGSDNDVQVRRVVAGQGAAITAVFGVLVWSLW
ncbi:hypothetical protein, partial [Profundibacterium mesophilum]|uniref:hypothetical protein n=1 Tax=Profundibacterium mesophilum TaxID=1258573 RepID=UPI00135811EE